MNKDKTQILTAVGKELSLKEILDTKLDYIVGQIAQSGSCDKGGKEDLYHQIISTVEKSLIRAALKHADSTQVKAAQLLGINRNTLRKKIKELGIED